MTAPRPWIVTAARAGEFPKQLRCYAYSRTHALETARELFPGHLLSVPTQEPDWYDDVS